MNTRMHRCRWLMRALASFVSAACIATATTPASAATYYWSFNGTAQGGNGTWDTTTPNRWGTTVGSYTLAWDNSWLGTAFFGGTAGTVSLNAPITVGGLTFGTATDRVSTGANTLSFGTGNNTIAVNGAATITGTMAGAGSNLIVNAMNQAVANTLTLNGTSTGGWTGTTTITPAITLTLAQDNRALADTSSISLNGGGLTLTNANSTEAAHNRVNDSASITSNGGGTITFTNTATANVVYAETLGALTLNSGQLNLVLTNNQTSGGSPANSQTLTLGSSGSNVGGLGFSRAGSASAVTFSSGGGLNTTTNRIAVYGAGTTSGWTDGATSNPIIGPWATVGTAAATQADYAVYSGGYVVAANTAATAANTWSTIVADTSNYTLANAGGSAANGRLTTSVNVYSVRSTSTATSTTSVDATNNVYTLTGQQFVDGDVVNVSGTGGVTSGTPYYIINSNIGNGTFQISTTPGGTAVDLTNTTAGQVTGGITLPTGTNLGTYGILNGSTDVLIIGGGGKVGLPTIAPGNLFVTAGAGQITIDAPIVDTGSSNSLSLVKNGSGALVLRGSNAFTGDIVINAGQLTFSSLTAGMNGTGKNITFGGSGTLQGVANWTGGQLSIASGAVADVRSTLTFTSLIGSGTLNYDSNQSTLTVGDASAFTGILRSNRTSGNSGGTIIFSSLSDASGAGNIQFGGGTGDSNQRSTVSFTGQGTTSGLELNNRKIELLFKTAAPSSVSPRAAIIENNSASTASTFVINTDVLNYTDRNTEFMLGGSNTGNNAFTGLIGDSVRGIYQSGTGALSLYKNGAGKWIVSGSNTFTGRVIVSQGTLSVSSINDAGVAGPLGMGSLIQLGGKEASATGNFFLTGTNSGTLEYTGSGQTVTRSFQIGDDTAADTGGGGINNIGSTGELVFNATNFNTPISGITANRTLTLGGTNTGNNSIEGVIQDNAVGGWVNLAKTGTGTWMLAGSNTFSGNTTVNAGTLILNYATNDTSKLNDTSALILGGGTLTLSGGSSHTEVVGSTVLTGNTTSSVTSTGRVLRMNGITFNAGSAIDFGSGNITSTTTANNGSGILSNGATVAGADWATNSGNVENGSNNYITAYTGYSDVTRQSSGTKAIPNTSTANVRIIEGGGGSPANLTLAATTTAINTLNQSISGGTGAASISMANQTLRTNAILMGPTAGDLTIGASGGNATLSGNLTNQTGTNGVLYFINNSSSNMTVNSVLADNSTGNSYIKTGTGTLILAGDNTFNVAFRILDGLVKAGKDATSTSVGPFGSSTSGSIILADKSTAGLDINGFNVFVKDLQGGGANGGNVVLTAGKTLTIANPGGASAIFNGIISGGGNLVLTGTSGQTLNGANTYSGTTTIGSANIGVTVAILADGNSPSGIGQSSSAASNLVFTGSGTNNPNLTYTSSVNASTNRQFTLNGNGGLSVGGSGSVTWSYTGAITHGTTAAKTLTLGGSGTGRGTLAAQITDNTGTTAVTKTGTSSWDLSNASSNFTGNITLNTTNSSAGTLAFASAGGTNNIVFNQTTSTATLSYIGSAAQIMSGNVTASALTTGTITFDASGTTSSATVSYTSTSSIGTSTNTGARNIVFSGSNVGNNTFAPTIANNTGVGGTATVTKNGAGTWVLSGTNSYTGVTTVNAGTLLTTKAAAMPAYNTAGRVVFNGGTVGVQVGGSGWTTTEVDSLLSNATKTSGALGIDTTNGNISQWVDFTTTNLGTSLGLAKLGTGTLTLNGTNTYNGLTTVAAGTLLVTGSLSTVGGVVVSPSATFGGNGTINGNMAFDATSLFNVLNVSTPFNVANGTVTFGAAGLSDGFGINNLTGIDWTSISAGTYTLITGNVSSTNLVNVGSGNAFDVGSGKSAYFQIGSLQLVVVPEPATLVLLGASAAVGGLYLWRRRRS